MTTDPSNPTPSLTEREAPFTEDEWRQMRAYVNGRGQLPKFIEDDPRKHYARWVAHWDRQEKARLQAEAKAEPAAGVPRPCEYCHGKGYVAGDPEGAPIENCPKCDGMGNAAVMDIILEWYKALPQGTKARISLAHLHTLSKALLHSASVPAPQVTPSWFNDEVREYALDMTDKKGAAYLLALVGEREADHRASVPAWPTAEQIAAILYSFDPPIVEEDDSFCAPYEWKDVKREMPNVAAGYLQNAATLLSAITGKKAP